MYFLYSLALLLLFLALLPYFTYQAIRHNKYADSLRERLGRLPGSLRGGDRPTIWVHAVSVGEFNAALPLIESIRRDIPGCRLVVSTVTLTGQRLARAKSPEPVEGVFYFPFDLAFIVRRTLNHIAPSAVIILETELWPNFLRECRRRGITTVIANGRISPRSFGRYSRARRFIARVMRDVSLLIMQSDADAERALRLGAPSDRVTVCGNLKYDIPVTKDQGRQADSDEEIDKQFALSSSPHLIVAGSTAPGEEKILITALHEIRSRAGMEKARLVIAPRHPERFDEVANLLGQSGFSFARRSETDALVAAHSRVSVEDKPGSILNPGSTPGETTRSQAVDVILLDTIGELATVYKFASVVFVGGSLVTRGGHNIIEPAAHSKPILVGPHTENFRQVVADFSQANALIQMRPAHGNEATGFAGEVVRLLSDRESAKAMGERAHNILLKNRGATECTVAAIRKVMNNVFES